MEAIGNWSIEADKFSVELGKSVADHTSRMKAFEAATSAPLPMAPPREAGGRASGQRVHISYQGDDVRNLTLHHTLIKGELSNSKFPYFPVDNCEYDSRKFIT